MQRRKQTTITADCILPVAQRLRAQSARIATSRAPGENCDFARNRRVLRLRAHPARVATPARVADVRRVALGYGPQRKDPAAGAAFAINAGAATVGSGSVLRGGLAPRGIDHVSDTRARPVLTGFRIGPEPHRHLADTAATRARARPRYLNRSRAFARVHFRRCTRWHRRNRPTTPTSTCPARVAYRADSV